MQSDRHGVGAIEEAVRNQGHNVSFLELLVNWGAANLLSDNTDAPSPYQYNTGSWRISHTGGIEFRLGSINLYNYVYAPGRLARPGPYLHPLATFNDLTQPPHSNRYTTLGRNSGTIRLRVSAESDSRITVVVKSDPSARAGQGAAGNAPRRLPARPHPIAPTTRHGTRALSGHQDLAYAGVRPHFVDKRMKRTSQSMA